MKFVIPVGDEKALEEVLEAIRKAIIKENGRMKRRRVNPEGAISRIRSLYPKSGFVQVSGGGIAYPNAYRWDADTVIFQAVCERRGNEYVIDADCDQGSAKYLRDELWYDETLRGKKSFREAARRYYVYEEYARLEGLRYRFARMVTSRLRREHPAIPDLSRDGLAPYGVRRYARIPGAVVEYRKFYPTGNYSGRNYEKVGIEYFAIDDVALPAKDFREALKSRGKSLLSRMSAEEVKEIAREYADIKTLETL